MPAAAEASPARNRPTTSLGMAGAPSSQTPQASERTRKSGIFVGKRRTAKDVSEPPLILFRKKQCHTLLDEVGPIQMAGVNFEFLGKITPRQIPELLLVIFGRKLQAQPRLVPKSIHFIERVDRQLAVASE